MISVLTVDNEIVLTCDNCPEWVVRLGSKTGYHILSNAAHNHSIDEHLMRGREKREGGS